MALRKLTKRNLVKIGYIHRFRNIKTGEVIVEETTKKDYESLANSSVTKDGYEWVGSSGGADMLDTPNYCLGEDEYYIKDGLAIIKLGNVSDTDKFKRIPEKQIADDMFDESLLINKE